GQGMEFAEVREYQAGDEVRSIDWNVTARMNRPYVKRYSEERELTVMLAVDLSGSERFGTRRRFKSEIASELAAVLAMSAIRNNDRVGALLFTDHVEHVLPPKKGRRHALRLIRDLLVFEPEGSGTDIPGTADYLIKMLPHKSIVFLVSDFLSGDIERPLKLLAQRHDLVAVSVEDPSEQQLPDLGVVRLVDPETGRTISVDTSDPSVRAQIAVQAAVGIEPDTVRIGDPFLIQIGIRAPQGATIVFPPAPDSTGAVQGLDPVRVETRPDSGGLVQWGYYRVAAWDVGEQPI